MKINNDEKEYYSNTLKCYFFLKRKEKELNKEILRLDDKIESEQTYVAANGYDSVVAGSGCSVTVPKPQSVNYLVAKQLDIQKLRDNIIEKYNSLDQLNDIKYRLSKLDVESRMIINYVFERNLSLEFISKMEKKKVSKQTISNRLNLAIEEFIKHGRKK